VVDKEVPATAHIPVPVTSASIAAVSAALTSVISSCLWGHILQNVSTALDGCVKRFAWVWCYSSWAGDD
jgi:hypothetical protein